MIIFKRRRLFMLTSIASALIIFMGIKFYLTLKNLNVSNDLLIKYHAEEFFYLSIIVVILLNLIFFYTLYKSKKIFKDLNKIIELSKYGSYDITKSLKKMGTLGQKINRIFEQLTELEQMKTVKITSLSRLNDLFIENINMLLLTATINGTIENCSNRFLKKFNLKKEELADLKLHLRELFPSLDEKELLTSLEKFRAPIAMDLELRLNQQTQKGKFIFSPVFNVDNQLAVIVVNLENKTILSLTA